MEENCIGRGLFVNYKIALVNVKLELVAVYKKFPSFLEGCNLVIANFLFYNKTETNPRPDCFSSYKENC